MTRGSRGGGGANGAAWMKHLKCLGCLKRHVWSDTNEVNQPRHPISDEFKPTKSFPLCTVVYTQTNMEEELIVAVCGHPVLYDTTTNLRQMDRCSAAAFSWCPGGRSWHRPELTGPRTGLWSAWGTAGTGRHRRSSWRRQWNSPSSVRLQRTSWTQTRRWVVFQPFWDLYSRYSAATVVISVMIDVERERVEKYGFKNERVFFFSPERQAQMVRIVPNDQSAQYKHLKQLYSRLLRLFWTQLKSPVMHG